MIESRVVVLFTDHKPLSAIFQSRKPAKLDRQQRHLSVLSEYLSDVQYIRGEDNIVADCLSRPTLAVEVDTCDLPALAREQLTDSEIVDFKSNLKSYPLGEDLLWCDISLPYPRPYVPIVSRKPIFQTLHGISHPGVKGSLKLIKQRYYWPNMDRCIREFTRNCEMCQKSKITRHTNSPVSKFALPSERFTTVHIDIVGPLPPSKRHGESFTSSSRYLLTCIDRATKWVEATPLSEITAASVAAAFLDCWVSRFGVPLYVVTDRGTQFESELFSELAKLIGFFRLRTTAYHPQTNGLVERMHRVLKTAIVARNQEWLDALPVVLLGIRNSMIHDYSPFMAVTGTNIMFPRPIAESCPSEDLNSSKIRNLFKDMQKLNLDSPDHHGEKKHFIPKNLKDCSHVWLRVDRVRKPLEAPYQGPFKVCNRSDKVFILEMPDGSEKSVSIDRLKPASMPSLKKVVKTKPPGSSETGTELLSDKTEEQSGKIEEVSGKKEVPKVVTRSGRTVKFNPIPDCIYYDV